MPSKTITASNIAIKIVKMLGLNKHGHGLNKKRTGWNYFNISRSEWRDVRDEGLVDDASRIGLRLQYNEESKMLNLFVPTTRDHASDLTELDMNNEQITAVDATDTDWMKPFL